MRANHAPRLMAFVSQAYCGGSWAPASGKSPGRKQAIQISTTTTTTSILCMTTTTISFNGASSTAFDGGCRRRHLHSGSPDQTNWQATGHWWDGDTGSWSTGHLMVALIQFAAIFGHGSHQITPATQSSPRRCATTLTSPRFRARAVTVLSCMKLLCHGTQPPTWRSFTGNNGLGYSEYGRAAVATVVAQNAGWHELDVTTLAPPLASGPSAFATAGLSCRKAQCSASSCCVTYAQTPPMPPTPPLSPPPASFLIATVTTTVRTFRRAHPRRPFRVTIELDPLNLPKHGHPRQCGARLVV